MTRFVLLTAFLVASVLPTDAQIIIGAKAGLNTSFWTGPDADNTDARLGFSGGLMARFNVNRTLALQTEALYSQKGVNLATSSFADFSVQQAVIEIPVLVRVGLPVSQFADAGIYAGPSFGIPVSASLKGEGSNGSVSDEVSSNTDIGVAFGADFFSGPFGVDLRYTAGLTDPVDDVPAIRDDVRNQVFTASFVYRFGQ